jgi:hypothetical protein
MVMVVRGVSCSLHIHYGTQYGRTVNATLLVEVQTGPPCPTVKGSVRDVS